MIKQLPLCFFFVILLWACSNNDEPSPVVQTSPVIYEINQEPFEKLSDYNFFEGELSNLSPVYGVIPYEPINSLFADYAHKKRFVWMPLNTRATYVNDWSLLDFPIGTILIKNFYYENVQPSNSKQIIETRLMLNTSNGWQFANYIWNEEQTDAFFDMQGDYKSIEWIEDGETKSTTYRIPSESECFSCHKFGASAIPIGPKPQNLNKILAFSDGNYNQLQKLINFGYLNGDLPANINSVVKWDDPSSPIDLRMRSYVDINCAHCHTESRYCGYRSMRFAFHESDVEYNMGICVNPDTQIDPMINIVVPQNKERSVLYFRLSSVQEEYRMPLLGRTLVHEEALPMVEEWINSITEVCE